MSLSKAKLKPSDETVPAAERIPLDVLNHLISFLDAGNKGRLRQLNRFFNKKIVITTEDINKYRNVLELSFDNTLLQINRKELRDGYHGIKKVNCLFSCMHSLVEDHGGNEQYIISVQNKYTKPGILHQENMAILALLLIVLIIYLGEYNFLLPAIFPIWQYMFKPSNLNDSHRDDLDFTKREYVELSQDKLYIEACEDAETLKKLQHTVSQLQKIQGDSDLDGNPTMKYRLNNK